MNSVFKITFLSITAVASVLITHDATGMSARAAAGRPGTENIGATLRLLEACMEKNYLDALRALNDGAERRQTSYLPAAIKLYDTHQEPNLELVTRLICMGADPGDRDQNGKTALELATENHTRDSRNIVHTDILDVLHTNLILKREIGDNDLCRYLIAKQRSSNLQTIPQIDSRVCCPVCSKKLGGAVVICSCRHALHASCFNELQPETPFTPCPNCGRVLIPIALFDLPEIFSEEEDSDSDRDTVAGENA